MTASTERYQRLNEFLVDSFNPNELEMFLTFNGYEDVAGAVVPDIGMKRYTLDVIEQLDRRSEIDRRLFDRLRRERPSKGAEIELLRSLWLGPDSNEPTMPAPPSRIIARYKRGRTIPGDILERIRPERRLHLVSVDGPMLLVEGPLELLRSVLGGESDWLLVPERKLTGADPTPSVQPRTDPTPSVQPRTDPTPSVQPRTARLAPGQWRLIIPAASLLLMLAVGYLVSMIDTQRMHEDNGQTNPRDNPKPSGNDVGWNRDAYVAAKDPFGETVTKVVYLDQGWSSSRSLEFYFTSQGSQIIPYSWFLALEQADSTTQFRENQNILRFRYLPQEPDSKNPDGLPVGFVKDSASNNDWLGLNCAACHTSEIHYKGTAYRVDGAPSMGDVRTLVSALVQALQKTRDDSHKFDRFAKQVLKENESSLRRELLRKELGVLIDRLVGYNRRNFPGYDPQQPAPTPTEYARFDALGAYINEVYYHAQRSPANPVATSQPANAPVSYPHLWNTPGQNLVQWVGLPHGGLFTLARNVAEALGVFADYRIPDESLFLGYPSSIRVLNLLAIQDWLKELRSPQWPSDFPPIDQASAAKGKVLYQQNCVRCHVLIDRHSTDGSNTAFMSDTGTDDLAYINVQRRTGPSGRLEGGFVNVVNVTTLDKIPATAEGLMMVSNTVIGTILGNRTLAAPDDLSRVDLRKKHEREHLVDASEDESQPKYKGRALDGIWATAPYLHNGSVPNLYELLQPSAQRSTSFSIGARTFDPEKVGYLTDVPGFPKFNAKDAQGQWIPGNRNDGHDFGSKLSEDERHQLLEYLKTL
jgi:hypothetical protein